MRILFPFVITYLIQATLFNLIIFYQNSN